MADDKKEPTPPAEIVGGPGQGEPAPEPRSDAPALVPVKYRDRELKLPADIAEAWTAREQEFNQRFGAFSEELGGLRKWRQEQERREAEARKPAEPDLNAKWFESPTEAAQILEQRITSRLEAEYTKRETERARAAAVDRFFTDFYREHNDLQEDDWVVRAQFSEHFDALADLKPREARAKLADITRGELLRIARKTKTPDDRRPPATLVEPASNGRVPRASAEEEEEAKLPKSLAAAIRARQQAKSAAAKAARGA